MLHVRIFTHRILFIEIDFKATSPFSLLRLSLHLDHLFDLRSQALLNLLTSPNLELAILKTSLRCFLLLLRLDGCKRVLLFRNHCAAPTQRVSPDAMVLCCRAAACSPAHILNLQLVAKHDLTFVINFHILAILALNNFVLLRCLLRIVIYLLLLAIQFSCD